MKVKKITVSLDSSLVRCYFNSGCGYNATTILEVCMNALASDYQAMNVKGSFPDDSFADAFLKALCKYNSEVHL